MSRASAAKAVSARVTSSDVAANLRALTVRFEGRDSEADARRDAFARVDQIVALFLEKYWMPPRRFEPIQPLSYMLFQGPDDATFAEDVTHLASLLERHLFGEGVYSGVEVRCLVGDPVEIEGVARGSEEAFSAAHEAARVAQEKAEEAASRGNHAPREDEGGDEGDAIVAADAPSLRATGMDWNRRLRLFAGYDGLQKAVLSYVTTLAVGEAPAVPMLYDEFGRSTGATLTSFEFEGLRYAVSRVVEQSQTGAVCHCLAPLSYETLADRRSREAYLNLSGKLPEHIRRYIVPSVFGGPSGPASSFLMEVFGALRRSFKVIDWQTPTCAIDLEPFKHANIFAITLVPPRNAADRTIEMARLPQFVRRLNMMRICPCVTGIIDRSELEEAIEAGVRQLSGRAVSGPSSELKPLMNVDVGDLPLS